MKKTLSALFMVFAVAFGVMLFSGTSSKALSTWNANIRQTDAGESSIKLQWEAYLGADFYDIYFSYDNNSWQYMDYSGSTSVTIDNLTSGATYYVKIIAYSGYSWSDDKILLAESASIDVVTSPEPVKNLKQTGATTTSVTMGWTAVKGASGYVIYRYNSWDNFTLIGSSQTNSYTLKGLTASSAYDYFVVAVRVNSLGQAAQGTEYTTRVTMKTIPSKVAYVSMTNFWSALNSCTYGWNPVNNADGYEFQLLNYKGGKILTKELNNGYTKSISIDPFKKGVFTKARCRAYILVNNKKLYGAWSGYNYNASCKNIKVIRSANRKKITLKWSKIKGAAGYQVYVSTKSSTAGYKKIKSLGAKKTSYSFTKVGKKKLSKSKTYYIKIKYLIKVGKKKVSSSVSGMGSI